MSSDEGGDGDGDGDADGGDADGDAGAAAHAASLAAQHGLAPREYVDDIAVVSRLYRSDRLKEIMTVCKKSLF